MKNKCGQIYTRHFPYTVEKDVFFTPELCRGNKPSTVQVVTVTLMEQFAPLHCLTGLCVYTLLACLGDNKLKLFGVY